MRASAGQYRSNDSAPARMMTAVGATMSMTKTITPDIVGTGRTRAT